MGKAADPTYPAPIKSLSEALEVFLKDLCSVTHCAVEVSILTFADDVQVENDFEDVNSLVPGRYATRGGNTNLGGAIGRALDEVEGRRQYLRQTGVEVNQPWLICITDGQPNMNTAPGFDTRLADMIHRRKLLFLPVAVGGYGVYDVLERLSPVQKPVVVGSGGAGGLSFTEFFKYLSQSMAAGAIPNLASLVQNHE